MNVAGSSDYEAGFKDGERFEQGLRQAASSLLLLQKKAGKAGTKISGINLEVLSVSGYKFTQKNVGKKLKVASLRLKKWREISPKDGSKL